jgi:uncharacterized membrane protein
MISQGLEVLGVAVIGIAFLYSTVRVLLHIKRQNRDSYRSWKAYIGKGLQLGLEFLVAADIVRTVTVRPTRAGIVSLGLLVLLRTFLSWSITVEIEGCRPLQLARNGRLEAWASGKGL